MTFATYTVNAQSRRLRLRQRPQAEPEDESLEDESELTDDYDGQPQSPVQYYTPEPIRSSTPNRYVTNDDYNGVYGQLTTPTPRSRIDYNRPAAKSSTVAPRTKDPQQTKAPPVQTIRNYSKVNDDGSFTFGYEAADGSFKEETRGTDCVVRGKYGYVDPDGNKREFAYVSGNPCDPNHPDETQDENLSEEDPNEPENVPQNYPVRRPNVSKPVAARPPPSPPQQQYSRTPQTTTHPTTVFQNTYSSSSYRNEDDEDEQPESIQLLQQQPQRTHVSSRPQLIQQHQLQSARPEEVTIRQRPRITVANTTPQPLSSYNTPTRAAQPVSITPRPTYRIPQQSLQTQPPATTYRPSVHYITQKPVTYKPTLSPLSVEPLTKSSYASVRKPIDFAVEFQKFQQEHNALQASTTPRIVSSQKPFKPSTLQKVELGSNPTSNPIYESQLVFDPSTGQYDSALYQQLPQSNGDFSLNHRHQPYVHQPQFNQAPHLVSLEQLQQQQQPIYQRASAAPTRSPLQFPQHQFSQQIYQKEQENNQVLSSQQLYAQQQELQQQQLHQDRLEASKRIQQQQQQPNRFPFQAQSIRQEVLPQQQSPQGFYYVQQPQQSTGQIDAFLRGHNLDFN